MRTTLNTAVAAPMASASTRTAVAVKPGLRRRPRRVKRTSAARSWSGRTPLASKRGLAPLLDAAEREQGFAAGRRGVGAGPDARGLVLLEMKADLLVQIALPPATEEQRPEPLQEVGDHRSASRTRRIPSTAAAVRRQAAVSASSWRRPRAVSA